MCPMFTMEQHPVPQNVTTFQFRLIGDMTIKQFGYLAGGAILAYVSYKLPLPFFFTWPMAVIFAVGGFGFAFVPVEERPMDIWVLSFLKNVYSPTLFVWQKAPLPPPVAQVVPSTISYPSQPVNQPKPLQTSPSVGQKNISGVLQGLFGSVQKPVSAQPAILSAHPPSGPLDWLLAMFSTKPHTHPQSPVGPTGAPTVPMPSVTGKRFDFSLPPIVSKEKTKEQQKTMSDVQKQEEALETKVGELKKELETKTITEARILELQKQLTEVLGERDRMQAELITLKKQSEPPPSPAVVPTPAPQPQGAHFATPAVPKQPNPTTSGPTVKIITPEGAVKAGLPRLTSFPNVVTGIIKDNESNLLPGVLVTVKDKEGVPLRALKTNRLGQFAASTPLSNGTYFIEIEDPRARYVFDRVQITLNGSLAPAVEVIAKSQKELNRAKLAQELFGAKPT